MDTTRCLTPSPEDAQPGCGDPLFGSVLSMMISRQFQRVDGRTAKHGRYYTECRFCLGTDIERPLAIRTSTTLVAHDEDCALAKYLPTLRAMAAPPTGPVSPGSAPNTDAPIVRYEVRGHAICDLETGEVVCTHLTSTAAIGEALRLNAEKPQTPLDPRDPDPTREGIFQLHNCARCRSGEKPCVEGNPRGCSWLQARND